MTDKEKRAHDLAIAYSSLKMLADFLSQEEPRMLDEELLMTQYYRDAYDSVLDEFDD